MRDLVAPGQYRGVALLLALMALSGLTEGLGLILLVPMLELLGKESGGRISGYMSSAGFTPGIGWLLIVFVVLVALRAVIVHQRSLAALRLETGIVDGLRHRAWRALLHCEWRVLMTLKRASTASLLITRVDRAGMFVNQAILALSISITLAGIALAALAISPTLAIGGVAGGLLIVLAFLGMRRRATALGLSLGQAYAEVFSQLDDGLQALRVIKALGREEAALSAVGAQFARLRSASLNYTRDIGRGQIALQTGGAALLAGLVWTALVQWRMPVATILPVIALFARALPLIGSLQQALLNAAHGLPDVREALALIAQTEAAREEPGADHTPPALREAIRLIDVTVRFSSDDAPALSGVTATIPARGVTVLTGPSGAGKSTLADLIGGLLDPDEGEVRVDDTVLQQGLRQAWRQRVAYVQQDPVVLSASLRDNLRWAAPEADDERLREALREAAADFALALPQGLDTPLGDGGRSLSGGERQRLMLARALLREPDLLILDEATSAIDAASEAQIVQAVARLGRRMAVVVISHRGALLALADQTVSLDRGRIVVNGDRAGAAGDDG